MPSRNRDPWKKRGSVRVCAAIDMIFAFTLITLYILRLTFDNSLNDGAARGFFKSGEKTWMTALLWVAAFSINLIQFAISFSLFTAVKRGFNDSDVCIPRAKYWLIVANAVFVMMISKLIYFVFFDRGNTSPVKVVMLVLCIGELMFKAYGMYFVKEFLDNLKASYSPPPVKVQFIALITNPNRKNQTETTGAPV